MVHRVQFLNLAASEAVSGDEKKPSIMSGNSVEYVYAIYVIPVYLNVFSSSSIFYVEIWII